MINVLSLHHRQQDNSRRYSQTNTQSAPRSCYNCGSPHHFSRDCPRPRNTHPSQNFPKQANPSVPPNPVKYIESQQNEIEE